MFAVHCPNHDAMVLLGVADIERMTSTSSGIAVNYHCTCGHRGTWYPGRRTRRSDMPEET